MKRVSRKRNVTKKTKPKDLRRVTLSPGVRMWVSGGNKYSTLREVPNRIPEKVKEL